MTTKKKPTRHDRACGQTVANQACTVFPDAVGTLGTQSTPSQQTNTFRSRRMKEARSLARYGVSDGFGVSKHPRAKYDFAPKRRRTNPRGVLSERGVILNFTGFLKKRTKLFETHSLKSSNHHH
jgi:hypothetical protein